jgi:hypothetical protein
MTMGLIRKHRHGAINISTIIVQCPPPRTFRQSDVRRLTSLHVTPGGGGSESGRTEIKEPKKKGEMVSDSEALDVCRHREHISVLMAIRS